MTSTSMARTIDKLKSQRQADRPQESDDALPEWKPYDRRLQFRRTSLDEIPHDAYGLYGFWYGKRCLYIGKAERQPISDRLRQHWRATHNQDLADWIGSKGASLHISYFVISPRTEIDQTEAAYIRLFQPLANKTLK